MSASRAKGRAAKVSDAEVLDAIEEFHRHVPGAIHDLEQLLATGEADMSPEEADDLRTVIQVLHIMQDSKLIMEAQG